MFTNSRCDSTTSPERDVQYPRNLALQVAQAVLPNTCSHTIECEQKHPTREWNLCCDLLPISPHTTLFTIPRITHVIQTHIQTLGRLSLRHLITSQGLHQQCRNKIPCSPVILPETIIVRATSLGIFFLQMNKIEVYMYRFRQLTWTTRVRIQHNSQTLRKV